VRRLRVETTKLLVKGDKPVESARVLREVTIYDPKGKKLDSIAYPVEGTTLPGKEEYQYDAKGNIIEMTLRAADGSILSKEKYEYEFDQFGNWKKMVSAVAVYENGRVAYEPTEVTYRTITYYYDQQVSKLTSASINVATPNPKPALEARPKPAELQTVPAVKNETPPVNNAVETEASKAEKVETPTVARLDAKPKEDRKLPVIHVTEETLRKASLELPEPEYPKVATIGRVQGKVEVRLDIDERGMVINARPISGSPLLFEAAANAGRKARFSPGALSSEPATVFGVITYEFALPPEPKSTTPDTSSASLSQPTIVAEQVALEKAPAVTAANQKAIRESASERVLGPPESPPKSLASGSSFEKGMASLGSANYSEAVEFFKQATVLDPTDAIAFCKLGIAYSALKEHKEAIRAFKEAIRIKRAFVDAAAYYLMGNSYISLGENGAAIEPLRQSLYAIRAQELVPKPDKPSLGTPTESDIRYALGLAYYGSGSFRKAATEFEEAIRINKDSALAHYGLGLAYLEVGDRVAAIKQQKILEKLKSPLADTLRSTLLTPVTQKRTTRLVVDR